MQCVYLRVCYLEETLGICNIVSPRFGKVAKVALYRF